MNIKFKFIAIFLVFLQNLLFAIDDPLPSWNDRPAKQAILRFIQESTQKGGTQYVAPEDRIATFDQDGTLWVEHPIYSEMFFAIDSIKALAPQHPEWKDKEPFQTIISGDLQALSKLSLQEVEQIIAATHTGMTVEAFQQHVRDWLQKAVHPRFKKPFTDLIYQPMLEVIQLLRNNGFKVYIVSGGGQEFIREYAQKVYGIPPEQVIGSAVKTKYEIRKGQPVLWKLPQILLVDDKGGKPEGINLIIGKRPVAAFGNSDGDQQMLEWTQAAPGPRLELLVYHDDDQREYAYGANTRVGTFSDALMDEAKRRNWIVVSMKNDWKVIFPWQK